MIANRHVDDCNDIPDKEKKKKLKEFFTKRGLPHIITESHIIITPDTVHDQSAVMHFFRLLINHLKETMLEALRVLHSTSDGAPNQFANKDIHYFVSTCRTLLEVSVCIF